MSAPLPIYRTVATALWALVASLAAFNIGALLAWPLRHVFFLVVLAVGVVLLISLNVSHWRFWRAESRIANELDEPSKGDAVPTVVTTKSEKLTGDAARQWLDDFLVEQQKK